MKLKSVTYFSRLGFKQEIEAFLFSFLEGINEPFLFIITFTKN